MFGITVQRIQKSHGKAAPYHAAESMSTLLPSCKYSRIFLHSGERERADTVHNFQISCSRVDIYICHMVMWFFYCYSVSNIFPCPLWMQVSCHTLICVTWNKCGTWILWFLFRLVNISTFKRFDECGIQINAVSYNLLTPKTTQPFRLTEW